MVLERDSLSVQRFPVAVLCIILRTTAAPMSKQGVRGERFEGVRLPYDFWLSSKKKKEP